MLFKAFWKNKIFTETGCTQMSNFDPNLPFENGQNQKYLSHYQSKSKSRPYLLSVFNENCNYFLIYLVFFRVQMGPCSKIKRSQLRLAPLSQKPLIKG